MRLAPCLAPGWGPADAHALPSCPLSEEARSRCECGFGLILLVIFLCGVCAGGGTRDRETRRQSACESGCRDVTRGPVLLAPQVQSPGGGGGGARFPPPLSAVCLGSEVPVALLVLGSLLNPRATAKTL